MIKKEVSVELMYPVYIHGVAFNREQEKALFKTVEEAEKLVREECDKEKCNICPREEKMQVFQGGFESGFDSGEEAERTRIKTEVKKLIPKTFDKQDDCGFLDGINETLKIIENKNPTRKQKEDEKG